MFRSVPWLPWALLSILGCGAHPSYPEVEHSSPAAAAQATAVACDAPARTASLLKRHGEIFGGPDAVHGSLPAHFTGTVALGGAQNATEKWVTAGGHRNTLLLGEIPVGSGLDAEGPWESGLAGVLIRLRPDEAASILAEDWVARRQYLRDSGSVSASCDSSAGQTTLAYARPDLGSPALSFDDASAALLRYSRDESDGSRTEISFSEWSPRSDVAPTWPMQISTKSSSGQAVVMRFTSLKSGHAAEPTADLAPPQGAFTVAWPKSRKVTVPMRSSSGWLLFRAKVGGRDAWALLDSGAALTAVDSTSSLGQELAVGPVIAGSASTQRVSLGLGRLPSIAFGGLELRGVPSANIPIPLFANVAPPRPEVVPGYSLFAAMAIRIDYAKNLITFAPPGTPLASSAATALPIKNLRGKLAVNATVEGRTATYQVDTGNTGGFDLWAPWAESVGVLNRGRPTAQMTGLFGAGSEAATTTFLRLASASLGPIEVRDHLVQADTTAGTGTMAGTLGNRALAKCQAVIFDLSVRTMWLEPPCDRAAAGESSIGWQLQREPSESHPKTPWVVRGLLTDGAAARAGLTSGDRLLRVGSRPATELDRFSKLLEQAPGTQLEVVVLRGDAKVPIQVTLRHVLLPE